MPRSNRGSDAAERLRTLRGCGRARLGPPADRDRGSIVLEVFVLGVLLLVPLVYLVLTVADLQGAEFAAEGAARQAARSIVLADDDGDGRAAADAAVQVTLADWHVEPDAASVTVACAPDPGDCLTPRGTVRVGVEVAVALPLLPPVLAIGAPGSIPVQASATQTVSMFEPQEDG